MKGWRPGGHRHRRATNHPLVDPISSESTGGGALPPIWDPRGPATGIRRIFGNRKRTRGGSQRYRVNGVPIGAGGWVAMTRFRASNGLAERRPTDFELDINWKRLKRESDLRPLLYVTKDCVLKASSQDNNTNLGPPSGLGMEGQNPDNHHHRRRHRQPSWMGSNCVTGALHTATMTTCLDDDDDDDQDCLSLSSVANVECYLTADQVAASRLARIPLILPRHNSNIVLEHLYHCNAVLCSPRPRPGSGNSPDDSKSFPASFTERRYSL